MTWNGRTVLVTGGCGFIGSHLVEALVASGARVRVLDLYTSERSTGNLRFIPSELMEGVEVRLGDIQDAGCVDAAVSGCDVVFHLAALIGIPYSYEAPRSYVSVNVSGTLNVLEAVRRHETPRLVHTSTSEVYGSAQYTPIDEGHPLQGQSPYSATKMGADALVESYHRSFEVPATTVRPFNCYGPRQSARAVIPTIISQLMAGDGELSLGSLHPKRDLTFVSDTVRGFLLAADCDGLLGRVVNLGFGKSISIGELAETLVEQIRPGTPIRSRSQRERPEASEVLELLANATLARDSMGWAPEVSLQDGLVRTTEFVARHPELFSPSHYTV